MSSARSLAWCQEFAPDTDKHWFSQDQSPDDGKKEPCEHTQALS